MKKRIVTVALVLALLATCFAGTYAYLMDTDAATNVMTLGNVKIEQNEWQRAKNEDGTFATATVDNRNSYVLEPFAQDKMLVPSAIPAMAWDTTPLRMSPVGSAGSAAIFVAESNAQDKIVTVTNNGNTDAYVRTLVAIEIGTGSSEMIGIAARANSDTTGHPWNVNNVGVITVNGNTYFLKEYIYIGADDVQRHVGGVLPANETTYPSLCQVYLKSTVTNEDMEAIDGNDNGKMDILVMSQAVQAAGFADAATALDTAFGDVTGEAFEAWWNEINAQQ